MHRPFQARPTIRPVQLAGEASAVPRPVLLDSAALRVGSPIWVRLTEREDSWQQGTITGMAFAEVQVTLLE